MNMMNNPTLDELAQAWKQAKIAETMANADRLAIEAQITELVGLKEEGTTTIECDGYKIKTVGKLTRSLDSDGLQADWDSLPSEVQKCFKWKAGIDTKNLHSLESMRDDLVPVFAKYVTTKPAKPSVIIEDM